MLSFYRENARWLIGGFLLAMFSGFGQTFFISIWGSEIREAYSLTHGDFGLLYMVATLASAACLPFVGRLVDVTSVATCSVVVIILLAVAGLIMGFASTVPALLLAIFMLRLFGQGMMTHTAMTAMGRWYAANRGKAVSFATTGHQASEALGPTIFVMIAAAYGWRESWMIASGCLIVFALPCIVILMRVERIPKSEADRNEASNEIGRQWTRREMLTDRLFWLTAIGVFSPAFIGTSIFFHQDYLIEVNGWTPTIYYNSFALMAAATVTVALITGFCVDRWSATRILPLFMLPLCLACLVLGSFSSQATIIIFMLLLGVSYGISSTLFGAIWPEVYGIRHLGALRSITVSFMVFMSAAGPGVTGWLIDLGIPFSTQLLWMSAFSLMCVGLMTLASKGYLNRANAMMLVNE